MAAAAGVGGLGELVGLTFLTNSCIHVRTSDLHTKTQLPESIVFHGT